MEIIKETEVLINIELAKKIEQIKSLSFSREIVFLCVGNSKIWYDSFGPMIGSLFQHLGLHDFVYGNMRSNINKDNLQEYRDIIYRYHNNPYVIVVDNALSVADEFSIKIVDGETKCAAMSDNQFCVGDLSILCLTPKNKIKNSCYYFQMISQIKKIGLYFKELYL